MSTSSRLLRPTKASKAQSKHQAQIAAILGGDSEDADQPLDYGDEEESYQPDELEQIKEKIDTIDAKINKLGGLQQCGWDPADHKDFLRIKTKHKDRVNTVAFLNEMRRAVGTLDEEEIKNHI